MRPGVFDSGPRFAIPSCTSAAVRHGAAWMRLQESKRVTRYYIRQKGEYVSGPHDLEHIRTWIKEGKVREEMEFSEDKVEWIWGIELPELFARRARTERRRRRVH